MLVEYVLMYFKLQIIETMILCWAKLSSICKLNNNFKQSHKPSGKINQVSREQIREHAKIMWKTL